MTAPEHPDTKGYDALYAAFDAPLMAQMRREAYGEDIGQHSWVTADQLRSDIELLSLSASSRLLDVGCGPCGPLVFAIHSTGCKGLGVDVSGAALASGRARASAFEVQKRITLVKADLNLPLPFADQSFDAVMSLDVIIHVRYRKELLDEIARVLLPAGKFLFTDAGIITGAISNEEIDRRSAHGYTQFVPREFNEGLLKAVGFTIIGREDRTASVELNARGRLSAMYARRTEFEALEGKETTERQLRYLETVIELSERRALARVMYFAELAAVQSGSADPTVETR